MVTYLTFVPDCRRSGGSFADILSICQLHSSLNRTAHIYLELHFCVELHTKKALHHVCRPPCVLAAALSLQVSDVLHHRDLNDL